MRGEAEHGGGRAMAVSVVIPTHNRAARLLVAVESVLAQTRPAAELIVVDDGSTDDTAARLQPYGNRIRYLYQPHAGVSAARNRGAAASRGDWVAFLDSDDRWLPDKLRRQSALHESQPELAISQTGEMWIRNGTRVNPCRHHTKPSGDIFMPSLQRCLVSPSAVMIRRDVFHAGGGFDETLPVCEDYDLWLRLALRWRFELVPAPLVVKIGGHADQLSRRYWGMDRFRVRSLARLLAGGELSGDRRRAAARVLAEKCAILAQGAVRRGRVAEARRYQDLATMHSGAECATAVTGGAT